MAMDQTRWRRVVSGECGCPWGGLLRPVLRVLSRPYAAVAALRRRMYAWGWKRSHAAAVPVISIGNITAGGTGKTPMVAWVVKQLQQRGRTPAILTRGYKAAGGVSDEAAMLERMTGAMVVVGPDRIACAARAVEQGADVLVMDDGFQHVRLRRDLDIVTIDATCPFGYGAVLPRGLLREPLGALKAADVFVLTRCDQVDADALAAIRRRLGEIADGVPIVESVMQPTGWLASDGAAEPVDSLADRAVWAFCGLGNPDSFYRALEGLAKTVAGRTTFNDHYAYSCEDILRLCREARQAGADVLVTTGKDAVKIDASAADMPIRWLAVDVHFPHGPAVLADAMDRALSEGGDDEQPVA